MKLNTECEICNTTIKQAVRCIECNNFFCKKCIESWYNSTIEKNNKPSCPHCRKIGFNYQECSQLDDLINSASTLKCEKCLRVFFKKEEFDKHQLLCLQIKCLICHELFKDNDSFINHFEQKGRYKEKELICNYLNANPYSYIHNNIININNMGIANNNEENENGAPFNIFDSKNIQEYKQQPNLIKDESKMGSFINNFDKNPNKIDFNTKDISNYKGIIFFRSYGLFYCNKINGINNKLCYLGNEMCKNCMEVNQKLHKLKKHYLINSAGRVCTYRRHKVHCLCHFQRYINKGNKIFCPDLLCLYNDICKPCQEINKLLNKYLAPELIDKLKKRDENNGY